MISCILWSMMPCDGSSGDGHKATEKVRHHILLNWTISLAFGWGHTRNCQVDVPTFPSFNVCLELVSLMYGEWELTGWVVWWLQLVYLRWEPGHCNYFRFGRYTNPWNGKVLHVSLDATLAEILAARPGGSVPLVWCKMYGRQSQVMLSERMSNWTRRLGLTQSLVGDFCCYVWS